MRNFRMRISCGLCSERLRSTGRARSPLRADSIAKTGAHGVTRPTKDACSGTDKMSVLRARLTCLHIS
jgi:hypothetical protein